MSTRVKVTEFVFPYHVLNDAQLSEQYRVQEELLFFTDKDHLNNHDTLFDILLNLKYLKKEMKSRGKKI